MNLLAIVGGGRKGQSTDALVDHAIEGVQSVAPGCHLAKVNLLDHEIRFCKNCLACMQSDTQAPMARCAIRDDMDELNLYLHESDCIIFGTPIHMGCAPGVMATFLERICWVFAKPGRTFLTVKGCPIPRSDKQRHGVIIATTGIVAPIYRRWCDEATPLIKGVAKDSLNCKTVGDLYAGEIWRRGADRYVEKARRLGERLALRHERS